MENTTLEFSTIKTKRLVNKIPILKNMFGVLKETESDEVALKEIFMEIIEPKDIYREQYDKLPLVEKTPRRYGKVLIENDILKQNGESTELQKTMLALNDLKSMYINLNGKGTSDRFKGTNKISDADGKTIRAIVRTFRKKTEHIRNPKK